MTDNNSPQKGQDGVSSKTNSSSTNSRRRFLTKAAIGATIASIPAHSVWAGRLVSGNMSGNVSGWGDCDLLAIWSHGKFKTPKNSNGYGRIQSPYQAMLWSDVFGIGRDPFNGDDPDLPLQHFIDQVAKGQKVIDAQLAAMFVNAALSPFEGVFWPVVANGLFSDAEAYAQYLWDQADQFGSGVIAGKLGDIIDEHHAGGKGEKLTCDI